MKKFKDHITSDAQDRAAEALFAQSTGAIVGGMRTYRAEGDCPRCRHHMTESRMLDFADPNSLDTPRGPGAPPPKWSPDSPIAVLVRCACQYDHEGAPSGAKGCGAEFVVTIPPERIRTVS